MDLANILRNEIVYGSAPSAANPMRIVYNTDANFIKPMGVSMTSILEHNEGVEFHAFSDTLPSDDDAARFARTMDEHGSRCVWHVIDPELFMGFRTNEQWSPAIYFRIIVGDYFYGKADRFMCVEADMICLGDLREAYAVPLTGGKTMGAVKAPKMGDIAVRQFNVPPHDTFYGGMYVFDTAAYHDEHIIEREFRFLEEHRDLGVLAEDTLLRVLYNHKVAWLPDKFNVHCDANKDVPPDTVVLHYEGQKPWSSSYEGPRDNLFRRCQTRSEWADAAILVEPRIYQECRYAARGCWHRGEWSEWLKWYGRYLKWKLFGVKYEGGQQQWA